MSNKNEGITLITLVITIIILLILASVGLNVLMGDNGLITNAKLAKERTEEATFEENVNMIILQYIEDLQIYGNGTRTKENLENAIKSYNYEFKYLNDNKLLQIYYLKYNKIIDLSSGNLYDNANIVINIREDEIILYANSEDKKTYKLNIESIFSEYTIESNDETIAKVDSTGNITAIGIGTCQIIAKVNNGEEVISDKVDIKVEKLVEGISFSKTSINDLLKSNNSSVNKLTDKITATISNNDASNKELEWSSSNPNIANVDQNGNVTAVSAGNCEITAKAKDESQNDAKCAITVKERKYLYYNNEQYSSITGGWIASNTPDGYMTYYSSLYSVASNYLCIGHRNGGVNYYCNARTVNTISTEEYNSLVLYTKKYVHAESWQGNSVACGMSGVSAKSFGGSSGINQTSLDIIDISQKHNMSGYIYIQNVCGHTGLPYTGYDPNSYIYLYQAYLEK